MVVQHPKGFSALPQLSLFDSGPVTPADRLLFAIPLGAEVAGIAAQVGRQVADGQGWRGAARPVSVLHITLNDIGIFEGLPRPVIDKAVAAGGSVACAPFDVTFDRVGQFGGRQAIMVLKGHRGLETLMAFRQTLVDAMMWAGMAKQVQKSFTPHVTLQYGKQELAEQAIEPICWTVRDFSLIHSPQGQTRHQPLATWRLGEDP